jgi:hypothetical protein
MARRKPGQQLARHRLGTALRGLREEANMRIEAAARELECSPAKISRLENGLGPAKLWDVRILLDLYGVKNAERRSEFEEWARDTKLPGWWEADSDLTDDDSDRFLAIETAAAVTRIYSTPVPTALLQTVEYATAHLRALHPEWPDDDIDRFVQLRMARREAVVRAEDPLRVDVVIDEGALRRRVGTRAVHAAQLRSLIDPFGDSDRDHVTIRVLPLAIGVPGRALSAFTLFEPGRPDLDPVTAYVDRTLGGTWLEDDAAAPLADVFRQLVEMSLDPQQSQRFLRDVLGEL